MGSFDGSASKCVRKCRAKTDSDGIAGFATCIMKFLNASAKSAGEIVALVIGLSLADSPATRGSAPRGTSRTQAPLAGPPAARWCARVRAPTETWVGERHTRVLSADLAPVAAVNRARGGRLGNTAPD